MRFVAEVHESPEKLLAQGAADVVIPDRRGTKTAADGRIVDGRLEIDVRDPAPGVVWGLRINGHPVAAFPVSITRVPAAALVTVSLGKIVLVPDGREMPLFHAEQGGFVPSCPSWPSGHSLESWADSGGPLDGRIMPLIVTRCRG